jgi:hypothetical protein
MPMSTVQLYVVHPTGYEGMTATEDQKPPFTSRHCPVPDSLLLPGA